MAFSRTIDQRRAAATLASGLALSAGGAVLVFAWQAGWWATIFGATLCVLWLIGLGCWSALHRSSEVAPLTTGPANPEGLPLRPLLDQVPVPLLRIDGEDARAINQAARALFGTDDRILPPPPELLDRTGDRLRHEGRSWRINAVETGPGQRLAVLIDVEAAERAAEVRANDEMIDILGHELLNGLSPIVSLADSAVTAAAHGDAMLPDVLATLARRVEGLESFTRAYRALSRLPDPVPASVSLRDFAEDLARLFASRFGTAVTLCIDVPDRIATLDRDQLTQALWAILQNGAEAALIAAPPCRVDLSIEVEQGRVTMRVIDTGGGIDTPDRTRIFRPFFTTKPQGSGIGLCLARRIVRAHGGDLRLLPVASAEFELQVPDDRTVA